MDNGLGFPPAISVNVIASLVSLEINFRLLGASDLNIHLIASHFDLQHLSCRLNQDRTH